MVNTDDVIMKSDIEDDFVNGNICSQSYNDSNDEVELSNAIESTDRENNVGIYIHFGTLIVMFESLIVFNFHLL